MSNFTEEFQAGWKEGYRIAHDEAAHLAERQLKTTTVVSRDECERALLAENRVRELNMSEKKRLRVTLVYTYEMDPEDYPNGDDPLAAAQLDLDQDISIILAGDSYIERAVWA